MLGVRTTDAGIQHVHDQGSRSALEDSAPTDAGGIMQTHHLGKIVFCCILFATLAIFAGIVDHAHDAIVELYGNLVPNLLGSFLEEIPLHQEEPFVASRLCLGILPGSCMKHDPIPHLIELLGDGSTDSTGPARDEDDVTRGLHGRPMPRRGKNMALWTSPFKPQV